MSTIGVVLVEDHDLTRLGMRAALQQCDGIEVIGEAVNGLEGLKLLEVMQPDVAIIDIGLPDIDGIELTQRFKASASQLEPSQTKVLILTLQNQSDIVLAAFAAGADSYCTKEASFEQMLEALRLTYQGYSWIDPAIARIILQYTRRVPEEANATAQSKTVLISPVSLEDSQMIATYPVTQRELEVLELIVQGYSNAAISQQLYITVGTVKTHVRNILNKLCVDDRTQAAVRALRSGIVS